MDSSHFNYTGLQTTAQYTRYMSIVVEKGVPSTFRPDLYVRSAKYGWLWSAQLHLHNSRGI